MNWQPKASHFINGDYQEDINGAPLEVTFPATGEVIANLYSATETIMDNAIIAAQNAQKIWADTPLVERGRVLKKTADIIRSRNQILSEIETMDTGKALQETLVADASSAADALEYFGGLAASISGEMIDHGGDWSYTKREPLGVVLGIGAWNYPMQIAAWKAAPALACGNAMIFKPSEMTPLTALKLAEIFIEAGAPEGLFNVVQGFGEVGAKFVEDKRIDKVSLTGSVPTGKRVYAAAAANVKHVTMELGGKSALIIFDDADIESAISGIMLGNFYSTGQICSNGTRVFVHESIHDKLIKRLIERLRAIKIGDPRDLDTQMGPMISQQQRENVLAYIDKGKAEGARLECGGEALSPQGFEKGAFISPAVFSQVSDHMAIAREEIFGPVASILSFKDEDEVIHRANDTEFGLAAGVYTSDLTRAHRVIHAMQAGTCWINAYNLTPVEMPFGGYKSSGIGRENGRAAIEYYSQLKSVYIGMNPIDLGY